MTTTTTRPAFETDDLIILLLGAPGGEQSGHLDGVTRLGKLVFLAERETALHDWLTDRADFGPSRFGPFSSLVYADLVGLVAARLLTESVSSAASTEDQWESMAMLLDECDVDAFTTRSFELAPRGKRYYDRLIELLPPEAEAVMSAFKQQFAGLPLRQLVRYIHMRYPRYTVPG